MTTGTLKHALGKALLVGAATFTTFGVSTPADAQDKTISKCTGGNASVDPYCPKAITPKPTTGNQTGNQPVVVQTAVEGGNVNFTTPKLTGSIVLSGDAVGAPDPSSGIPGGYISETKSPFNIPLLGALGYATGITKPAEGVLELHLKTQECLNGVTTSDALGRISDNTGIVNYQRFKTVVNSCGGDFNALASETNACEFGTTITGACRGKPTPVPAPAPAAPIAPPAPTAAATLSGTASAGSAAGDDFKKSTTGYKRPPCEFTITSRNTTATRKNLDDERKRLEEKYGCTLK